MGIKNHSVKKTSGKAVTKIRSRRTCIIKLHTFVFINHFKAMHIISQYTTVVVVGTRLLVVATDFLAEVNLFDSG